MLLGIDHLVIAVRDPDAEAAAIEGTIGIAFTGGGKHAGRGTFNRLAFLGDTYLELIGVDDRRLAAAAEANDVGRAAMRLLDGGREGLATYAVATDDAPAEVARLRAVGSPIGDAVPGSRTRPDREVVHWITAFPALGTDEPPFLIEHELAGSEWGPDARAVRAAFEHPGGGIVRLRRLTLPVADVDGVRARYRDTLGIRFGADGVAMVGGQVVALVPARDAGTPVVDLAASPGTPPLDATVAGIRWRRTPADAPPGG